ncbi:MAG: hypothetical protein EOP50_10170 [Sphingobacteriales bacterium]|nr:MAG: hypothetical protein EOP50_10170 [Sphingobacteriales bacterium]
MRAGKISKKFSNYFLGPLLFAWLSWSIWRQLQHQPHLSTAWKALGDTVRGPGVWYVAALFGLMLCNWGIEAVKWRILVKPVQPITFLQYSTKVPEQTPRYRYQRNHKLQKVTVPTWDG